MKSANPQLGLVLTGGGAKGAYQAGALQYIVELGNGGLRRTLVIM